MIDFIKLRLHNIDCRKLIQSKKLDFNCDISKSTGAINERILVASYHGCEIKVRETEGDIPYIQFSGSIHKMWNSIHGILAPNGKHGFNGNQFGLDNIYECRKILELLFDCRPEQMIFQNLEFGINAEINFNPNEYIKGLLYHRNKMFEFRYNREYAQTEHQRFKLKIYNKGAQYNLPENTIRLELKFMKMIALKSTGIKTFRDITPVNFSKLGELLIKRFDEVVYFDNSIKEAELGKRDSTLISNYSNPRYWIDKLKPIHRDRHKKKLKKIISSHSDDLHSKIKCEIIEKCVMNNRV